MPLNLGPGIQSAGDDIGSAIARMGIQMQQEKKNQEQVQAMLDSAKQMQVPDMRTGKPKNFFSDDQLHHIQRLIDQKKYHAAGAMEATMGIGKDMYTRIQSASAKQADAYQKQQELARMQQQTLGGPYRMVTPDGVHYRGQLNEKGMVDWFPDTGVPKDAWGLNAKDQIKMQRDALKDVNKAQKDKFDSDLKAKAAQNTAFSGLLKGIGIKSPTDLFDPSVQQGGFYSPQTGFVSPHVPNKADNITPTTPDAQGKNMTDVSFPNGNMNIGAISHVRFYSDPAPAKGAKEDQPKITPVIPYKDFIQYQNAAAATAGPSAMHALQWLRDNPTNENADAVRKEIIARTAEAQKAPNPSTLQTVDPTFDQPSAPAQPYAPQTQVDVGSPEDQQVSPESAAQNPGY